MYDTNNIFAKILRKEIPCDVIYEDEYAMAFPDIQPAAPVHVLIVPKAECVSFDDFMQSVSPEKVAGFFAAVQKVAAKLGVREDGYRLITNHGRDASQTVPHFHVHLLAGRPLGGLLSGDELAR